jgi:uncharacterized protein (DUF58 family)
MTLAVMAGVSLLLLRRSQRAWRAEVEPTRLRMFKRTTRSALLRVSATGPRYARVYSVSVTGPFGVKIGQGELDEGKGGATTMELSFTPSYAGPFAGFRALLGVADPLMLFTQTCEVRLDLAVEALPTSLLLQERQIAVSPVTSGEVPTGTRGYGQEHYDIEPYVPGSDANDLVWKRVARHGEDELLVRVREGSMRGDVSMVVALRANTSERRVVRGDLASEAIAQVGKRLTSLGVRVEVAYARQGGLVVRSASNLVELSEAIVESWRGDAVGEELRRALSQADLGVYGPDEYEEHQRSASQEGPRLTLVVWDRSGHPDPGGRYYAYAGDVDGGDDDDLTPLAEAMAEG